MFDFLIAPLLLAVLTAGTVAALRATWLADRRARGRDPLTALMFSIAIGHVVLFMGLPAALRFLFDWSSERALHVSPSEVVFVYFIEFISFGAWCMAFTATRVRRAPTTAPAARGAGAAPSTQKAFLFLMLSFGALRSVDMLFFRSEVMATTGALGSTAAMSDRFFWPLIPATGLAGSVVGCYVIARGRGAMGNALWITALGSLALYLASFALAGVRGVVVWPALWTLLSMAIYRPGSWKTAALPVVLFIVAFSSYESSYLSLRDTAKSAGVEERLERFQQAPREATNLAESAEFRLGAASRYSVGFVRMWERGRRAYWYPMYNSAWAPLPRLFFPEKPWPTSLDGDQYSAGMYLCVTELHQSANFTMTEFLTGTHAYWEFGWVGVILLSAVGGVYAAFASGLAGRLGLAGPPVLLLFFKPWGYNNPKLWVADIVLELVQLVPAVIILWVCARSLTFFFDRMHVGRSANTTPLARRTAIGESATPRPLQP